jgi:hypothetical protein
MRTESAGQEHELPISHERSHASLLDGVLLAPPLPEVHHLHPLEHTAALGLQTFIAAATIASCRGGTGGTQWFGGAGGGGGGGGSRAGLVGQSRPGSNMRALLTTLVRIFLVRC